VDSSLLRLSCQPIVHQSPAFKKVTRRGQEGDAPGLPIRKDLNLDQSQKLTHPYPPFQGGNFLTVRDRRHLNSEVYELMRVTQNLQFTEAFGLACARLLIPMDLAWAQIRSAGLDDARVEMKKPAQSA
jgi:hypothetical protein